VLSKLRCQAAHLTSWQLHRRGPVSRSRHFLLEAGSDLLEKLGRRSGPIEITSVARDAYAGRVAERLLDYLMRIDEIRDAGRIYVP
jgi:hypothetical protein